MELIHVNWPKNRCTNSVCSNCRIRMRQELKCKLTSFQMGTIRIYINASNRVDRVDFIFLEIIERSLFFLLNMIFFTKNLVNEKYFHFFVLFLTN
jgi:hypothetical protein